MGAMKPLQPILCLIVGAACAVEPEGDVAATPAASAEVAVAAPEEPDVPAETSLEPCAIEGLEPCTRAGNVLLAGQPSAEALAALADRGVTAVLDLRLESEERGFDEPARARELGLSYERLGFGAGRPADDELLDTVRARLAAQRAGGAGELLVHCASAGRVGAVWLAARTLDDGLPWERALEEARAVGLSAGALEERVRLYVLGAGDSELGKLKLELREQLPDVPTISVGELAARLDAGLAPLLLDVRGEAEFAVSHLRGARRAETPEAAQALLAGEPREREVIVYCSIGYRSGHLAQALRRAGWTNVRNLEGSIFEWANTGHPVWRGDERAHEVHPYDAQWGRLLERDLWSELE
jgi:rhodanese-related sulfurtransferase/protein tyrosine phosphatase (PTP) superfamily phosphohydrolase (DUF442 family)